MLWGIPEIVEIDSGNIRYLAPEMAPLMIGGLKYAEGGGGQGRYPIITKGIRVAKLLDNIPRR